jgi:hypothetical protein
VRRALMGSPQAWQAEATSALAWARIAERACVDRSREAVWRVTLTVAIIVIFERHWGLSRRAKLAQCTAVKRALGPR